MQIEKENRGEFTIVRVEEERIDSKVAPDLKAHLLLLIEQGVDKILIDLSHVEYVDSSGLGALLFGVRQLRMFMGNLAVFGARKRVLNLIRIAKLEDILRNYESEEDAVKNMSQDV